MTGQLLATTIPKIRTIKSVHRRVKKLNLDKSKKNKTPKSGKEKIFYPVSRDQTKVLSPLFDKSQILFGA